MRTIAPQSIRDDFLTALGDVETTFAAAEAAAINATGKKLIAEFSFLFCGNSLGGLHQRPVCRLHKPR